MNDDDRHLFQREIGAIRRLANDRHPPPAARPPPEPRQSQADEAAVLAELRHRPLGAGEIPAGEDLAWCRRHLDPRILTRLRRGHYKVEDELDLHHLNTQNAAALIKRFVADAAKGGTACVRIVHGKGLRSPGEPKLKILCQRLLPRLRPVLAFASARPVDGGSGALYVLLQTPPRSY
mgnify:CR=1 FL=1